MTAETAKARLAELTAQAEGAAGRYCDALAAVERAWEVGRDLAEPLAQYYADVQYRRRESDAKEARRLTLDLLERVERDGVLLEPLNPARPAMGLRVVDPRFERELAEAQKAANAARVERDRFADEAVALLKEAADREKMARVKTALEAEDPDALRDALAALEGGEDGSGRNVLTTDDLPAGAQR